MTTLDHRSIIASDTQRLITVLEEGHSSTPVPTCPGWTVAQLIAHTSTVHRMATAALTDAPLINGRPAIETHDGSTPLVEWVEAGLDQLLAALDAADPAAPGWTFLGERPKAFWPRRMAAETAIHRWDAENTVMTPTRFEPTHGIDMIDEFLDVFLPRKPAETFADADGRTLHLHATDADGEWVITRHAAGIDIERAHSKSTTAIRGSASSLALFVWNRPLPDDVEIFGDSSQCSEWSERIQF